MHLDCLLSAFAVETKQFYEFEDTALKIWSVRVSDSGGLCSVTVPFFFSCFQFDTNWEEGAFNEELAPSDWPVVMCLDIFLIDD